MTDDQIQYTKYLIGAGAKPAVLRKRILEKFEIQLIHLISKDLINLKQKLTG